MQVMARFRYYLFLLMALLIVIFSQKINAATPSEWWIDIKNDRAANVQKMLRAGADPNALSPHGQPAIMQAISDSAWNVYDVLLRDRRTDLNALNVDQETPLMYLSVVGETDKAKQLIKLGAQVNRLGWTPLHYAASKGHIETAQLLINNKAIVNAPAPDGTTPLMMAAFSGNTRLVQLLLDAGADATTLNLDKKDVTDWARLKNHTNLADKLEILIQKVLAQRAAVRRGNTTTEAIDPIVSLDEKKAAKPDDTSSSTSRYFDLDRFDNDEARP